MSEKMTRRDFLARWAAAAFGAVVVVGGAGQGMAQLLPGPLGEIGSYDARKHLYTMLIDVRKCIGCGSCVRACALENNVPANCFRTWIERYTVYADGRVRVDSPDGGRRSFAPLPDEKEATKSFFVPKLCNHCAATPCVQLCPVGASYRTADGVVLVDEQRCIGCGYCVQACPYGSRFLHPETHVASKCTLCYHRITKGLLPACVQACPTGARKFGDLMDPKDEVAHLLATEEVHVLKPDLLTEPSINYLGLSKEVV